MTIYILIVAISGVFASSGSFGDTLRTGWLDFTAPPGYFAVPFKVEPKNNHIWADGTIQGKSVSFLVDTGATNSSVSEQTAVALKLPIKDDGVVKGTTLAGLKRGVAPLPPVTLGGLQISSFEAEVFDFQAIVKNTTHEMQKYHGLIGSNLLIAYQAKIDYSTNALYLKDMLRYDLRCMQGAWKLESLTVAGKINSDPEFLAKFSLTIAGDKWRMITGGKVQVGNVSLLDEQSPKRFGLKNCSTNGKPATSGGQPIPDDAYVTVLPYEVSWGRFRFATPSEVVSGMSPAKIESTATNKTAILTWVRAR